jgi:hypothetical protein
MFDSVFGINLILDIFLYCFIAIIIFLCFLFVAYRLFVTRPCLENTSEGFPQNFRVLVDTPSPTPTPTQTQAKPKPSVQQKPQKKKPKDCDECGRKLKKNHVCKFYGYFKCEECSNHWTSGYCWDGESQDCRNCETETFPYKIKKLIKSESSIGDAPHDMERCSMCRRLGYRCSNI